MHIRPYQPADWTRICEIHDAARRFELAASGLSDAFLSLEETGESEGLFEATLLVAEGAAGGPVLGFAGFTDEELTWLYVDPLQYRRGVGRALLKAVVEAADGPLALDVLVGNEAALALYLSEGFRVVETISGKLAGNEAFAATAHVLRFEGRP
ncbi:GNAT family N-acetyltransferase [Roseateles sp. DAIF2]|uniref:GNAT family N-acetyltransferase n=1 Tax=Roseateles sp. DAIF2 TaxID=2714952 RepID=UPI0018A2E49E|nr:GNAT family N-acetyltransferase [Roseateles sp. DAIF2]QPF74607.1 GNAT family N-acetyltransferase [Roseateles sp. DAIF2]